MVLHRNSVIEKFGEIVGENVRTRPKTALGLLRAAYAASGLQMRYFPSKRLLPHQKYAAVRIRENLRQYEKRADSPFSLSLSIGYDLYDTDSGMNPRQFLHHIDSLMYAEKKSVKKKPEADGPSPILKGWSKS